MTARRGPKRTGGRPCPVCRGRLYVTSTKHPAGPITVRYRTCKDCGHKLVTEERPRVAAR